MRIARTITMLLVLLMGSSSVLTAQNKDVEAINNSIKENVEKYSQMSEAELLVEWNVHEKDMLSKFGEVTYYPGLSANSPIKSIEALLKDPNSLIAVWINTFSALYFKFIIQGDSDGI